MVKGRINLVMDGQWGSTGKGKLAGYLALRTPFLAASVCDFMTNAGHWFRSEKRGDFLVQQIPMAAVNPNVELLICAGAAITEKVLENEIKAFENGGISVVPRLTIDPNAIIIGPHHGEEEALEIGRISSTLKGCGAALAGKVMRKKSVVLAKDSGLIRETLRIKVEPVQPIVYNMLNKNAVVMGELAQGFDLSLNHGHRYPYVTSRDITPAAFLANVGLSPRMLGTVYGVVRTYPIRVGNVIDENGLMTGWSGPHYDDQEELDWETISRFAGYNVLERTTVTNKVRRIFTFSAMQYRKFLTYCAPDIVCLNFCNYLEDVPEGARYEDLENAPKFRALYRLLTGSSPYTPVLMFGTGKDDEHMVDMRSKERRDFLDIRSGVKDYTNERPE